MSVRTRPANAGATEVLPADVPPDPDLQALAARVREPQKLVLLPFDVVRWRRTRG